MAASLSGSWDTDVTIDPTQTEFNDAITLSSVLTVNYTVGDWTFGSVTKLSQAGWTDQDFSVSGVLGAFSLTSALDFVPATPAFGSWQTTAGVSIAGVSFGLDFTLADDDVELILSGSGVAGVVSVEAEVTFGGIARDARGVITPGAGPNDCSLDWSGVTVGVDFPFICADIESTIKFNCKGFDSIVFEAGGIAIPNLPWVTLDAELTFTMAEKTLALTPVFDFGTIVCFDLYFNVATSGDITLGDITIEGIGISGDIGGVTFTALSFWNPDPDVRKPGLLRGTPYWEVYQIKTTDDACCGPFAFDVAVYFLDNGIRLFDVALIDANMSLTVAPQFDFTMGLEMNVEGDGFTKWTIGFLVTW